MFSCGSPWLCVSLLSYGLILTATAQAQIPVGVIQTGSLTVSSTSSRPVFTVSSVLGRIVDIHSVFDDGAFEMEFCRPCVAGAQVGIGGRITSVGRGNQFYEVDFTLAGTPLRDASKRTRRSGPHCAFQVRGTTNRVAEAPRR